MSNDPVNTDMEKLTALANSFAKDAQDKLKDSKHIDLKISKEDAEAFEGRLELKLEQLLCERGMLCSVRQYEDELGHEWIAVERSE